MMPRLLVRHPRLFQVAIRCCVALKLFCFASLGFAVEVGDKVRVIRDAEIKVDNNVVGTVSAGLELKIEAINGDWVWVNPGKPGWLELRYVAPVGQDTAFLDDVNRVVRRYSNQRIVSLNPGEAYQFALAGGSKRTIRLVSVKEHRDSVIGLLRRADVRVEIDGQPVNLVCAVCDADRNRRPATAGRHDERLDGHAEASATLDLGRTRPHRRHQSFPLSDQKLPPFIPRHAGVQRARTSRPWRRRS